MRVKERARVGRAHTPWPGAPRPGFSPGRRRRGGMPPRARPPHPGTAAGRGASSPGPRAAPWPSRPARWGAATAVRSMMSRGCATRFLLLPADCARKCARSLRAASWRSPGLTIWYRSNTLARLVPRHRHGDALGHARVDHVADRGPAEVVPQHPGHARLAARPLPRLREVPPPLPREPPVLKSIRPSSFFVLPAPAGSRRPPRRAAGVEGQHFTRHALLLPRATPRPSARAAGSPAAAR